MTSLGKPQAAEANSYISEAAIASRVHKHRADIFRYLPVNLTELVYAWIQSGLLVSKDLDMYQNQHISREKKIRKLLSSLKRKPDGYSKFLQCLQESEDHMGHVYIASLLEDQYFADKFEIEQSAIFKKRIINNMVKMKDINLRELCPILVSKRLITTDEFECLTSALKLESERILLLFQILDTKGPTAHSIFVHCLGEENSHKPHKELFQLISGLKESSPLEKKRKREATDQHYASPEKRSPSCPAMHGDLTTEEYGQTVRSWRSWVSNGQWEKTEQAEQMCMQMQGKHLAMQTAILLQSSIARIFRKEYTKARQLLKLCDRLCCEVKGDNATYLLGRCKYTWSWLYRYRNKHKKSKKYASDAMAILSNVEPGEDRALVNYGYASILVDCHANAASPNAEEMKRAEVSLRTAIDCARVEDRGLDHIAPHSHLRLAQMYLGSTHYEPGKNTDPESIRKATDCLDAINLRAIPPRSRCMFFLTESDLYRCKGDVSKAKESAMCALQMAQENSFKTEVTSAETKLKSLDSL